VSVPALSVSAARTPSGAIVLALVNLGPHRAASISTTLAGAAVKKVTGSLLTGSLMDARNTFEAPQAIEPKPFTGAKINAGKLDINLPPKSVTVLMLQ
jgi:alpha-N-arabinofuranosidase